MGRNRDVWDPVESRTLPAGQMEGHSPMLIRSQKYCTKYPIKIISVLYKLGEELE
jgi:hypothetical protein